MSTSGPAADAAFEASVTVADEIEVAGDRTPTPDPELDLDLDLELDLDLLEPAGPGNPQQEQRQQSQDDHQGQGPDVREGHHHHNANGSRPLSNVDGRASGNGDVNNGRKRSQTRRVSHASSPHGSGNDSDQRGDHGMFSIFHRLCPR